MSSRVLSGIHLVVLILVIGLVAGCVSTGEPSASPGEPGTSIPAESSSPDASLDVTATPSTDASLAPTETPTDTPTATPTETPTESPTDTPTATPTATPTSSGMTTADAAGHVGQVATVCGTVQATNWVFAEPGHPTWLNLDSTYPHQSFNVVIWGEQRRAWPLSGKPDVIYLGKKICVTGKIEHYSTWLQIQDVKKADIKVVP